MSAQLPSRGNSFAGSSYGKTKAMIDTLRRLRFGIIQLDTGIPAALLQLNAAHQIKNVLPLEDPTDSHPLAGKGHRKASSIFHEKDVSVQNLQANSFYPEKGCFFTLDRAAINTRLFRLINVS